MRDTITIRTSTAQDRQAIVRLAALDSQRAPEGNAVLAFVGTELQAAMPIGGDGVLADPFRPTTELVELLRVRAGAR